jgi:4'-phosphopantetheinyl transferase
MDHNTHIWWMDVSEISKQDYSLEMLKMPEVAQEYILRYRLFRDRKLKLFARVMIEAFHREMEMKFDWNQVKRDEHQKPYIVEGISFNISHSGSIVVVAFSKDEIGVDIEETIESVDVQSVVGHMNSEEQKIILSSSNVHETFLRIWTRKEAYLKALGTGIVNGLNNQNCASEVVSLFDKDYQLRTIDEIKGYFLSICKPVSGQICMTEKRLVELL